MPNDELDDELDERFQQDALEDAHWDETYEEGLKGQSEEAVRYHLGTVGDAIEARVRRCLADAKRLRELKFYGAALVCAVSASELIIRFLLVRPLVSGAFLSEEWESILTERIGSGNTVEDRRILPSVLSCWGIELDLVQLPDGKKLWPALVEARSGVMAERNRVVHQGALADETSVRRAIDCAETMITALVHRIAEKFGFTLAHTGCWCEVRTDTSSCKYVPWDPIEGKPFHMTKVQLRALGE